MKVHLSRLGPGAKGTGRAHGSQSHRGCPCAMARPALASCRSNTRLWVSKSLKGQIIIGRESEAWAPWRATKIKRGGGILNRFPPFVFSVLDKKCRGTIKGNWQGGEKHQISPRKGLDQWAHGGLMGIFVPCLPTCGFWEAGRAPGKVCVSKSSPRRRVQVGTDWQVPGRSLIPSPHLAKRTGLCPGQWLCLS